MEEIEWWIMGFRDENVNNIMEFREFLRWKNTLSEKTNNYFCFFKSSLKSVQTNTNVARLDDFWNKLTQLLVLIQDFEGELTPKEIELKWALF